MCGGDVVSENSMPYLKQNKKKIQTIKMCNYIIGKSAELKENEQNKQFS